MSRIEKQDSNEHGLLTTKLIKAAKYVGHLLQERVVVSAGLFNEAASFDVSPRQDATLTTLRNKAQSK